MYNIISNVSINIRLYCLLRVFEALNVILRRLPLSLQCNKILFKPLINRFSRINRVINLFTHIFSSRCHSRESGNLLQSKKQIPIPMLIRYGLRDTTQRPVRSLVIFKFFIQHLNVDYSSLVYFRYESEAVCPGPGSLMPDQPYFVVKPYC